MGIFIATQHNPAAFREFRTTFRPNGEKRGSAGR